MKVPNESITKTVRIIWIPREIDGLVACGGWKYVTIPPIQAYRDSPRWEPVLAADAVIYHWNHEAVAIPRHAKWVLMWRTRRSGKIMATLVPPDVPGRRLSNVFGKAPSMILPVHDTVAATAILLFRESISWYRPSIDAEVYYPMKVEKLDEWSHIDIIIESVNEEHGLPTSITLRFQLDTTKKEIREGREYVDAELYEKFEKFAESWRP